jgi:hypothetical protein
VLAPALAPLLSLALIAAGCGPVEEDVPAFADGIDLGAALRACDGEGGDCDGPNPFAKVDVRTRDTNASVETLNELGIMIWVGGTLGDSILLVGYGVLGRSGDPVMTFRVNSRSQGEFRYRGPSGWETAQYKNGQFSASSPEAEKRFHRVLARYHADNGCWDDYLAKRDLEIAGQCLFCVAVVVVGIWIAAAIAAAVTAAGGVMLAAVGLSGSAAATAFVAGAGTFLGGLVSSIASWSLCGPCVYDGVIDPLWSYLDESHQQSLPKFTDRCIGEEAMAEQ